MSKDINKYVTFVVRDTDFAVPVMKTREIVEYGKLTEVPEAPDFIEGVTNLRGKVVPVVNLTKKFFNIGGIREDSSIIIVEPEIDGSYVQMGLLVDTVKDVLEFKEDSLEEPPKYGSKLKAEYLKHVVSYMEKFIMILDIDKVLSVIKINNEIMNAAGNSVEEDDK